MLGPGDISASDISAHDDRHGIDVGPCAAPARFAVALAAFFGSALLLGGCRAADEGPVNRRSPMSPRLPRAGRAVRSLFDRGARRRCRSREPDRAVRPKRSLVGSALRERPVHDHPTGFTVEQPDAPGRRVRRAARRRSISSRARRRTAGRRSRCARRRSQRRDARLLAGPVVPALAGASRRGGRPGAAPASTSSADESAQRPLRGSAEPSAPGSPRSCTIRCCRGSSAPRCSSMSPWTRFPPSRRRGAASTGPRLVGRVIDEGRNAVRGLRSPGHESELEQAFSRVRDDLADRRRGGLPRDRGRRARPLHPMIRDDVYRIGREAAGERRPPCSTRPGSKWRSNVRPQHLRVLVSDDGRGIEPDVLRAGRAGHWGLSGMRERAERVGGQLRVWSRPGAGTEVDFGPGPVASQASSDRRRTWFGVVAGSGLGLGARPARRTLRDSRAKAGLGRSEV